MLLSMRCSFQFQLCRTFLVAHERRTFTSTTSPHRELSSPGHIGTAQDLLMFSVGRSFVWGCFVSILRLGMSSYAVMRRFTRFVEGMLVFSVVC